MKTKHIIETAIECRCPFENCGKQFRRNIVVTYWTNHKGDVIDHMVS